MNLSKLEVGVEKAKLARLHCRGVNITYFEQALVEQERVEILAIL